jgi:hypothetical protein
VLGGFAMMLSGLFVMAGGGLMMLGFVQSGHFHLPIGAALTAWKVCRAEMQER